MSQICHACTEELKDDAQLACNGFCKAVFHVRCSLISPTALEEVSKSMQLMWMCQSCTKLMQDFRFRNSVRTAYEAGQQNSISEHKEFVEKLKSEITTELKDEIRINFSSLINSSSYTPKSSTGQRKGKYFRGRRLFAKFGAANSKASKQNDLMCGTGESMSPSIGEFAAPSPKKKFWLYLSRISRDVTVEQVRELATNRLATDDIDVVRLVAKGKDVSTMSFISFKVGVDPELKSRALSTSTWPKGVLFREFRDNRSENIWKPQKTPNITPPGTENSPSDAMTE